MRRSAVAIPCSLWFSSLAIAQGVPGASGPMVQIPVPSFATGSLPVRGGPVVTCVGDSECQSGTVSNPYTATYYAVGNSYSVGTQATSVIGWLNTVSGGSFTLDFVNQAYPGNYNGLYYARILTQGTGCPANTLTTITPGAPAGNVLPPNALQAAAAMTFTTDASGNTPGVGTTFYEPVGASQGGGYSTPTFSINQTCSVPPTFAWALTGIGTWGVTGETTAGWAIRIPQEVCAAKPDWALNIIGTNDVLASVAEATINANTLAGLQAEEACGIRPVLFGINARTIGVGGWTQTMDRVRLRVNAWRRNLGILTRASNIASTSGLASYPGLPVPVLYVDTDHYWNDPTQSGATAGNPISYYTTDGLHQSSLGAFTEGLAAWKLMSAFVPPPSTFVPNTQNDVYDATNNPGGNLMGTVGLFAGTSGSATAPCTTTAGVATSWVVSETGNAAMSCVGTLETTRTDGLPGTRQVVTISDTTGTATDRITLLYAGNYTANLTAGDQIYLEGDVDLSNLVQFVNIGCDLVEANPGVAQTSLSTMSGTTAGYLAPVNFSSATIAKWNEAILLPDWLRTSQSLTAASFRVHIRSAPLTVQSGDTGWTTQCFVHLNGATGTATATVKFGNFAVRKINAT